MKFAKEHKLESIIALIVATLIGAFGFSGIITVGDNTPPVDELPIIESTEMPESLDCTTCLLPMQYQKKVEEKFVWQCFRCGKKYFVFTEDGKTIIEETWGPPR